MSTSLRISLVQSGLKWGNVKENLNHFSQILENANLCSDLIVLPETFTSGFLMHDKHRIAKEETLSLEWMKNQAKKFEAVLLGSIIVKEHGNYFNRLFVVNSERVVGTYDKRHLFRMANEHKSFKSGSKKLIFNIGKWRICPLICYDLRFPVWSRNTNNYDLLIYIANWPESRKEVWQTLLKARAIENQAYTAGVNRIGEDGMKTPHSGGSCLFEPSGNLLGSCQDDNTEILSLNLNLKVLTDFKTKFPTHLDADSFSIHQD